jgi:hypothetical protein
VYAGSPSRLAHIIRDLGILEQRIIHGDHDGARAQAFGIHRSLAQALALQDQARFEPHASVVRSTLLHLTASLQDVFQEALDVGRLQWTPSIQALTPKLRAPMDALAEGVAQRLDSLAGCFAKGALERAEPLDGLWEKLRLAQAQDVVAKARSADVDAFLILSRRLVLAVARLEDVVGTYTGLLAKRDAAHPFALLRTG